MGTTKEEQQLADPKLLEKIDKLFELNIGEYVDLPQLLVVGDQSSGKSSVLEGLTRIPFPRDSGLCTRFATQITFRRAKEIKTTVTVIPSADAPEGHAEKLRAWKKDRLKRLERETFVQILKEVYELMGLQEAATALTKKTFSDDILKIEICGPDEQHYSVVDVPGIFKRTTAGVTTREDIDLVRSMVLSNMKNARSVILAVVPSNVDIATQEILEMAEDYDPNGQRTLGVLTKPDLVDKGAEHNVVSIVEGKSHVLKLGWCIVKNPGQEEVAKSTEDRHVAEKNFFKTREPWSTLSKDRVGNEALRVRLVEILADMVQREFIKVKVELNQRLKSAKKQLEALGPSRESQAEQYKFLLDLATRFQEVVGMALTAHYASDDVFDRSESFKLATCVVNRNTVFAEDIALRGHTMHFKQVNPPTKTDSSNSGQPTQASTAKSGGIRRHERRFNELEDVIMEECEVREPSGLLSIETWLEQVYSGSRGFELGTFDPSLLAIVWKKQSVNWDALALGYISDVVSMVHSFTWDLLTAICPDERARTGIQSVLLDELIARYKRSIDHTKFLLLTERSGTPLTTNHYFAENLEKSRQERTRKLLEKNAFYSQTHNANVVRVDATIKVTTASNNEHTVSDLHDILKSYYKVARKRFVDCVIKQASDHYLVTGPDTPVKVFSPTFVSELTSDQLDAIAGEEISTRRKRKELNRDIENLEKGKKVLF